MTWKHLNFHSCYALVKILMFSTHSMKYIWYSPQKSKYPLDLSIFIAPLWKNGAVFPSFRGSVNLSTFGFFSTSWERMDRLWQYFVWTSTLTRPSLGLLPVSFCKISTVTALDWHQNFIYPQYLVRFWSDSAHSFSMNGKNLTKFCVHINIDKI